jgi:hypothetical protein
MNCNPEVRNIGNLYRERQTHTMQALAGPVAEAAQVDGRGAVRAAGAALARSDRSPSLPVQEAVRANAQSLPMSALQARLTGVGARHPRRVR